MRKTLATAAIVALTLTISATTEAIAAPAGVSDVTSIAGCA